jgi:hypothetical protein
LLCPEPLDLSIVPICVVPPEEEHRIQSRNVAIYIKPRTTNNVQNYESYVDFKYVCETSSKSPIRNSTKFFSAFLKLFVTKEISFHGLLAVHKLEVSSSSFHSRGTALLSAGDYCL